eukprot:c24469_g1_i2 orf=405-1841(-)
MLAFLLRSSILSLRHCNSSRFIRTQTNYVLFRYCWHPLSPLPCHFCSRRSVESSREVILCSAFACKMAVAEMGGMLLVPLQFRPSAVPLSMDLDSLSLSASPMFSGMRALPFATPHLSSLKRGRLHAIAMTATVPKGHAQVYHSMHPEKIELFKSLEGWAETSVLQYLKPVEKCWQPQQYLPDPSSEGFLDQIQELRERSAAVPDDYLIVLVGDMITEEALPTYQTMLNTLDGTRDETGASLTPWARWTRAWTAEENRHGDLLNKYLYLSGRVDMMQIEKTIQYLIGSGMEPQTENNPYLGFIYTSFQERATFISHGNTARQAKEHGDLTLAKICGIIAADERRHENAYTKIVEKLFEIDPNGAMLAFEDMMRKKISMPAHLMYDGHDRRLFDNFSLVAQKLGIYTAKDYADIIEHLVKRWNIEKMEGLSSRAQKAQDYVCGLAIRFRHLEERVQAKIKKGPTSAKFSWIFDREVSLL